MNKYELAIVVGAKVEEEARTATLEKVKSLVTRFGGVVSEVKEAGVKKLAYEIQKQNEGFYYFVRFEANADAPAQIESTLRIMKDELLRFLCVSVEE
ncbi:MAG TPA: 30S ribosomal protein S6 [Eubacterium sp.]|nr:30S ribosomal protein S6 [Lachnospiraceae bacterium]HAZ91051.1 30S ribosomal protein S6 [Eubacterium sp.]HBZ52229.1 30S ribosomal protein S6 [Eubacterium sp.]